MTVKIGIRREDKNKWEARVPLTPEHCAKLTSNGNLQLVVQPSKIRAFQNEEYQNAGIQVAEDLSGCETIIAVKEIPMELLLENKTYMFFSHTIKGQPYNMPLLKRLMDLECNLLDYERVVDEKNRRLIFFGRHAGLAGMIDSLHALGKRLAWEGIDTPFTKIKAAHQYANLEAAKVAMRDVGKVIAKDGLPDSLCPFVIAVAGTGNVSLGVQEILDLLPHQDIRPKDLPALFANGNVANKVVKMVLSEEDLVVPKSSDITFDLQHYYDEPQHYQGHFHTYLPFITMLMNGIYWDEKYPRLVTKDALGKLYADEAKPRLRVIGDISCDPNGSIEFLEKITHQEQPTFVYEPESQNVIDGIAGQGPVVLGVDNLPCELSYDASQHFSTMLMPFMPNLARADFTMPFDTLNLPGPLKKALILHRGQLTPEYGYLEAHLAKP
ncbi:MAG: bifunctional lysine ketoglutarate reductase /saccharopine dehydrogenase family protein [Myxococcota bacterium]|nr:bifunctional lysine ketoglutarate reductase /saccharopine dehydrogenase family protein [Myxococcota bacterium]